MGGSRYTYDGSTWATGDQWGITTTWSGMISSAQKSAILGRMDKLIRATKKARQRANTQEVVKVTISKKLIDFLAI